MTLEKIYELYKFRKHPKMEHIFTSNFGPIPIAEVPHRECELEKAKNTKNDLDKAGYAVYLRQYVDLDSLSDQLYCDYFRINESRSRVESNYSAFKKQIEKSTGNDYIYIPGDHFNVRTEKVYPSNIVETVSKICSDTKPVFILLEAAAGFGKTCTAQEISKKILEQHEKKIPFYIELSRNRAARMFKYVLLDEVDNFFSGLATIAVIEQIKRGNLILIIDGFDELLHQKDSGDESSTFSDIESMLDTIKNLLEGKAKIILTTRRTAVLGGEEFLDWLECSSGFEKYRFRLEEPKLKHWLVPEMIDTLARFKVSIEALANPVLLSYLKNLTQHQLEDQLKNDTIVESYFEKILEREQSRQDIPMTKYEQLSLMKDIARYLIEKDVASENKETLRQYIEETYSLLLKDIMSRYHGETKPSIEELSSKLVNHAFLDAKNSSVSTVGFVNNYIFGSLIGQIFCQQVDPKYFCSEIFAEFAVSAYKTKREKDRLELWKMMKYTAEELMSHTTRMASEISLKGKVELEYNALTFSDMDFNDCVFQPRKINASIFANCNFNKVAIHFSNISQTSFIRCNFYDATIVGDASANSFLSCTGAEDFVNPFSPEDNGDELLDLPVYYERLVLEQFWPQGRNNYSKMKRVRTLYLGVQHHDHSNIFAAINSLKKRGLVSERKELVEIDTGKESLNEIMTILGRK